MRYPIALTAVATLIAAVPVQAQDNRTIVAEVRRVLAADYVVAEKRGAIDAALLRGLSSGRYDGVDAAMLAERITADLAVAANDAHLGLRFAPAEAAAMPAVQDDDAPDPYADEQARRWNHGVVDQRVLDGNIRYLDYRGFMWAGSDGRASAAALDRAMAFLREGDAIIIDLRANGGGDPRAARHLASYFVPARTQLVTFHLRSRPPETVYTETTVPGGRIAGPVYVLTSNRSVSAAEEFASHARHFGFATLVGTTTRGGAYRNALYPVARRFVLSVSIGRPVLTDGTNWEGRGVSPTIAVAADAALDAAQAAALRRIAARSTGEERAAMERRAVFHDARVVPVGAKRAGDAYAGRYGLRIVRFDGGTLTIQRGQGPVSTLVPIGVDRFALSEDPATQAQFTGTATSVTALEIDRADGRREPATREAP